VPSLLDRELGFSPGSPWSGANRRKFPFDDPFHLAQDAKPQAVAKKVSTEAPPSSGAVKGGDDAMCKTMSNEELIAQILKLRDEAVVLAQQRKAELLRWDATAKQRTKEWFNTSDDEIRTFLLPGIDSTIRVLQGLKKESFLRKIAENEAAAGCSPSPDNGGVAASVCADDTIEHRIFLAFGFCEMHLTNRIYGTNTILDGDTQLLTLVHEVTHFKDVFGSKDVVYLTSESRENASQPGMRLNADSLAAYILGTVESSGYRRRPR